MANVILYVIILAAFATLVVGQLCGQSASMFPTRAGDKSLIAGAQTANPNSHPWIVSLQRNGDHFCSGSLVDIGYKETDIVVTAAHCFRESDLYFEVTATAGVNELHGTSFRQSVSVREHFQHWDYDNNTHANDIAIVKLATPIAFNSTAIGPVCLPLPDEEVNDEIDGIVAGWGLLNKSDHETNSILMQIAAPPINAKACARQYAYRGVEIFPESMFCAGYPEAGDDSCHGDSGGPIVFKSAHGYTLQGLVSFGIGCAVPFFPGVYTRLSRYVNWLSDQVKVQSSIPGASIKLAWF